MSKPPVPRAVRRAIRAEANHCARVLITKTNAVNRADNDWQVELVLMEQGINARDAGAAQRHKEIASILKGKLEECIKEQRQAESENALAQQALADYQLYRRSNVITDALAAVVEAHLKTRSTKQVGGNSTFWDLMPVPVKIRAAALPILGPYLQRVGLGRWHIRILTLPNFTDCLNGLAAFLAASGITTLSVYLAVRYPVLRTIGSVVLPKSLVLRAGLGIACYSPSVWLTVRNVRPLKAYVVPERVREYVELAHNAGRVKIVIAEEVAAGYRAAGFPDMKAQLYGLRAVEHLNDQ